MKKLFVNILAAFIRDKDKRREFRRNHDKLYNLNKDIQKKALEHGRYTGYYPDVFLRAATCEKGIKEGVIKNKQEHLQNVEDLKANLEPHALEWLNRFFEIQELFEIHELYGKTRIPDINMLFDINEKREYERSTSLKNQVIKNDNYFEWNSYKLPIDNFDPAVFHHKHGLHELRTFDKVFADGNSNVIIDAGAFILDSALIMRSLTSSKIYSFEPTKSTYELGLKTIELNDLKDIVYEQSALGDKVGECKICIDDELVPAGNHLEYNDSHKDSDGYNVKVNTIDNYVKENKLKVGLIKSDVEGFEPALLRGAIETIKEQKPILAISIYHNYHDFYKIKPWIESLNLGYKFKISKGLDNFPLDIMLLCEVEK